MKNTRRLALETWGKVIPKDADSVFRVMYTGDTIMLAGLGLTEEEAMVNFCKIYLRNFKKRSK